MKMEKESVVKTNNPAAVEEALSIREIPSDWEPNIIAFACHYCAFAAADLAGVMRLSYPPSVKIIRLPCTGKLDYIHILHAFERGVDGVFTAG
jgi:hypothetical protein